MDWIHLLLIQSLNPLTFNEIIFIEHPEWSPSAIFPLYLYLPSNTPENCKICAASENIALLTSPKLINQPIKTAPNSMEKLHSKTKKINPNKSVCTMMQRQMWKLANKKATFPTWNLITYNNLQWNSFSFLLPFIIRGSIEEPNSNNLSRAIVTSKYYVMHYLWRQQQQWNN